MNLDKIDHSNLENAKIRVWNQLSSSIEEIKNTNVDNNSDFEANVLVSQTPRRNYAQLFAYSLTFVLLISFLATSALLFYRSQKNNPNVANTGDQVGKNAEINVRALAAARFEELNGVSYEKLSSVKSSTEESVADTAVDSPLRSTKALTETFVPNYREEVSLIDEDKAKSIIDEVDENQQKVSYIEQEVTLNDNNAKGQSHNVLSLFGIGNSGDINKHPKADLSRPFKITTWYNINYSKHVISQGDDIISFYLSTPSFSVEYLGGKYAVKHKYDGERFLTAYVQGEDINPEISFLKEILSDESMFKKVGTKQIDGKTLQIFELDQKKNLDSDELGALKAGVISTTAKYYVDVNNFRLEFVEEYNEDDLISSMKNISFKQLPLTDLMNDVTSLKEIDDVDIREISDTNKTTISSTDVTKDQVSKFVKKYNLYYIDNIQDKVSSAALFDIFSEDESINYYLSKDFNPMLEIKENDGENQVPLGYYSQGAFSFSVYKNKPIISTKGFKITTYEKNIFVDEKRYAATFVEQEIDNSPVVTSSPKDSNITSPDSGSAISPLRTTKVTYMIFGAENGLWYQLSGESTTALTTFNFSKLTEDQAKSIDLENDDRINSFPKIIGAKLDDIPANIRLLPGDLSKEYKLYLYGVAKSSRNGSQTNCDKYEVSTYTGCLVEKYNGFEMQFMTKNVVPTVTPSPTVTISPTKKPETKGEGTSAMPAFTTSGAIQIIVLDSKLSTAKPLIDKISDIGAKSRVNGKASQVIKEIDGKTVIITGTMTEEQLNKIAGNMKLDNGKEELKKQMSDVLGVTDTVIPARPLEEVR